MGCRAELLKPVEIPQVQFSDIVCIGSCAILAENIATSWVMSVWLLALSVLRVNVRGLSCRTSEARGEFHRCSFSNKVSIGSCAILAREH